MSDRAWRELFNGRNLTAWRPVTIQDPGGKILEEMGWLAVGAVNLETEAQNRFEIHPGSGVLVNGRTGRTANIVSDFRHGDCELHLEFVVAQGANSGVYFMGQYEIQILDSWGESTLRYGTCGGIYARYINGQNVGGTPPRVNASRPPGTWQSYDIVFRAPRFDGEGRKTSNAVFERVVWNDVVVHEGVELDGPTRASLPHAEAPRGPLMLQGDHGPVAYRNVRLRELSAA